MKDDDDITRGCFLAVVVALAMWVGLIWAAVILARKAGVLG